MRYFELFVSCGTLISLKGVKMGLKPLAEAMPLKNWDSSAINCGDQSFTVLAKQPFFLALAATYGPNAIRYPLYRDMAIGQKAQAFREQAVYVALVGSRKAALMRYLHQNKITAQTHPHLLSPSGEWKIPYAKFSRNLHGVYGALIGHLKNRCRDLGKQLVVISGDAYGPDKENQQIARDLGVPVLPIPADWSQGRGAGYVRNRTLVRHCDMMVAYWDQVSKGTAHNFGLCKEFSVPLSILNSNTVLDPVTESKAVIEQVLPAPAQYVDPLWQTDALNDELF